MLKNWDRFRHFIEIERAGSLKAAGEKLGVDPTTVGRNLTALEREMGVRLFDRRSDGFVLTEPGRRLFHSLTDVEATLIESARQLSGGDTKIEGTVRIAMPGALANHWLIPRLGPLLEKHPGLDLEFVTGPEVVNLARREADLAIRLVRPTQAGLVVRRVGEIELALYVSQTVWKARSRSASRWDLPFAGLYEAATSDAESELLAQLPKRPRARIRSGAWSTVLASVQGGYAAGVLPSMIANGKSDLVRIPDTPTRGIPLWLAYHADLKKSARLKAVIDYLQVAST